LPSLLNFFQENRNDELVLGLLNNRPPDPEPSDAQPVQEVFEESNFSQSVSLNAQADDRLLDDTAAEELPLLHPIVCDNVEFTAGCVVKRLRRNFPCEECYKLLVASEGTFPYFFYFLCFFEI
jgi:hypothetical protein